MLILFLKRIKRRASKIYHNFKMTHGYIHVVHEGVGSYKKYCGGDCLKTHSSQNVS